MAKLVHEIWEEEDERVVMTGLCLAGPDGESFRSTLNETARCVHRFQAESHFEAMTIYYRLNRWGAYTTDFEVDHSPYPDDCARRRSSA
jgi:hypothetical protein